MPANQENTSTMKHGVEAALRQLEKIFSRGTVSKNQTLLSTQKNLPLHYKHRTHSPTKKATKNQQAAIHPDHPKHHKTQKRWTKTRLTKKRSQFRSYLSPNQASHGEMATIRKINRQGMKTLKKQNSPPLGPVLPPLPPLIQVSQEIQKGGPCSNRFNRVPPTPGRPRPKI